MNISRFLRDRFSRRSASEPFIVLDIGTFSVKGLYISEEEVVAFSNKQYSSNGINTDGNINAQGIIYTCRLVLRELKGLKGAGLGRRRFTNRIILGIGGGFVYGKTITQSYIRDHPSEELNEGEFGNIIQRVQRRNYEQIRRDFRKETGRSELDVYLVSGALQDIKIDGHQVVNPIGFKGREVSCGLFNSYVTKDHLKIFEEILGVLKLELISVISEPYAVFSSVYGKDVLGADFILVDIGGSSTEISLVRRGRFDDARSISIGGSSFTRSISENLKLDIWEAENLKRRFIERKIARYSSKRIEEMIMDDVKLFFHGLEMALSDLSQTALLPSKIFIYGGGSMIPMISQFFKSVKWRSLLSFSSGPVISSLAPPEIARSLDIPEENIIWTVPFSLANAYIQEVKTRDDITKLVGRSLRLIQR